MSLPPELRVLCLQLSSTPADHLPRLTPVLLSHVLQCQTPLSTPIGNAGKADASASSVLVHKLKTQLTTLLNGRSPEGRFTSLVLIKAVVEVGGWEVLRGSEQWIRGLLSILGKPDPAATKELCIVALTKIYLMTHEYQALVREITTPTLPTFVTSCLNLISSKSPKMHDLPSSLVETIFQSFAALLPLHATIYRPFISQIRVVTKPYLAPTLSDGIFVSSSLRNGARRLNVTLHQTVAKNTGGEEWGKAVRELVKDIHVTSDHVFRAVVEDWESTTGYIADPVDVNKELSGGGRTADDLPSWTGISSGVERLVGLLGMLEEYFQCETSSAVSIPMESILDMINRMLSISLPSTHSNGSEHSDTRLNPAIYRDEKDGLWAGLPAIYVAALQIICSVAARFEQNFVSIAQGSLDQMLWIFPSGRHSVEFRLVAYDIAAKILPLIGQSLDRSSVSKFIPFIRSCCKDIRGVDSNPINDASNKKAQSNGQNNGQNVDSFLRTSQVNTSDYITDRPHDVSLAATRLLPLFFSKLPQRHIDVSIRSLIERTAILSNDRHAMLASVLNPFIGKNGRALPSILPHLEQKFSHYDAVEALLRPRMPLLPSGSQQLIEQTLDSELDDEEMDIAVDNIESQQETLPIADTLRPSTTNQSGLGPSVSTIISSDQLAIAQPSFGGGNFSTSLGNIVNPKFVSPDSNKASELIQASPRNSQVQAALDIEMAEHSDAESVHLTMQLDTDSESE